MSCEDGGHLQLACMQNIPTNLQARYDLFCVKSAVKPQPTNQPLACMLVPGTAATADMPPSWNQSLFSSSFFFYTMCCTDHFWKLAMTLTPLLWWVCLMEL